MKELNQQPIAVQGIVGSYHHQVAINHFGKNANILACDSFQKVADALNNNKASFGILAIENSIAGAILPNYALINDNHFKIVAEEYLNIKHFLYGNQGSIDERYFGSKISSNGYYSMYGNFKKISTNKNY